MNEEIFKIQKNDDVTFDNIHVLDGIEVGTCTICNLTTPIDGHICMTSIDEDNSKDFKTEIAEFRKENYVDLNDGQIRYINTLYNQQHIKYHRGFFKNIVTKAQKTRTLSKKEYTQLMYLLKNGKSIYEDGVLPKNY